MNLGTVKLASEKKPNADNCKNSSSKSVLMTVHNFSTQYSTEQF